MPYFSEEHKKTIETYAEALVKLVEERLECEIPNPLPGHIFYLEQLAAYNSIETKPLFKRILHDVTGMTQEEYSKSLVAEVTKDLEELKEK